MRKKIVLLVSLGAIALSGVAASAANASAEWFFSGTELSGTEAVLGISNPSTLSIPGAPVTCAHLQIFMKISNSAGTGKGEVTKLLPYDCTATADCTVQSIEAEKAPWPAHVTAILAKNYVVIEKVQIGIEFAGALCALTGERVVIKGTAGGLFENATSTLTFNKTSFATTGTSLKVGSTTIEWTGVFPMEALGLHSGEALEIG
jgi:hypothetical protein